MKPVSKALMTASSRVIRHLSCVWKYFGFYTTDRKLPTNSHQTSGAAWTVQTRLTAHSCRHTQQLVCLNTENTTKYVDDTDTLWPLMDAGDIVCCTLPYVGHFPIGIWIYLNLTFWKRDIQCSLVQNPNFNVQRLNDKCRQHVEKLKSVFILQAKWALYIKSQNTFLKRKSLNYLH